MKRYSFLGDSFIPVILSIMVLISFSLIPAAYAALNDATAAYQKGDYSRAQSEFRRLADQGNTNAQFNLGVMYYKGQGVQQDYVEAVQWWRKAAERGDADAQYFLAVAYDNGYGVPADHAEAMKWCRMAAVQGHAEALNALGPVDRNEARQRMAETRRRQQEESWREQEIESENSLREARNQAERERQEEAERELKAQRVRDAEMAAREKAARELAEYEYARDAAMIKAMRDMARPLGFGIGYRWPRPVVPVPKR